MNVEYDEATLNSFRKTTVEDSMKRIREKLKEQTLSKGKSNKKAAE